MGNVTRSTGRSNSFHVDVEAVIGLLRAAVNIAYMVGERYWPSCPGYEIIRLREGCPNRVSRAVGERRGTQEPNTANMLMLDTFELTVCTATGDLDHIRSPAHADVRIM